MSRKFSNRNYSFAQQILAMKATYPHFRYKRVKDTVTWVGDLQPNAMCDVYTVKIVHKRGKVPEVWVLSPKLRRRGDEKIPHTYKGDRLCLYLPGSGEWTGKMFIAETFVPWTILWLYFYEAWHVTGAWHGGGVHPGEEEKNGA